MPVKRTLRMEDNDNTPAKRPAPNRNYSPLTGTYQMTPSAAPQAGKAKASGKTANSHKPQVPQTEVEIIQSRVQPWREWCWPEPFASSNSIIKFAADMTVVGLITNIDKTTYREEVGTMTAQYQINNLNISKTKELIEDFRRNQAGHDPILINGAAAETVKNIKFLRVHIFKELKWANHMDTMVKKEQRFFNLRRLKKFCLSPRALPVLFSTLLNNSEDIKSMK
ncbi:uncharacterized protein si:dkey-148h10.5 isoform X2 [Oncorhynchus mykiss]|uniref:uncharacterized protein si:dkey-148h10.5 isoform X2 n=1 Tax=Oncorhynchus mykiss TaxID=8022 RepID=UPI001878F139|nr:uncharacterized protein si:dkey-148h10.5 isoform X2 [Oncorhynchus mykiss]